MPDLNAVLAPKSSDPVAPDVPSVRPVKRHSPDYLMAPAPARDTDPATWGRRGAWNRFGLCRFKATPEEIAHRRAEDVVAQTFPGPPLVLVTNGKGAAGKTITSIALGATFARCRGGNVLVWDTAADGGGLALRAAGTDNSDRSVWDVVHAYDHLTSPNAPQSALDPYVRLQPNREVVLAGDPTTDRGDRIGRDECVKLMEVAKKYRSVVIADADNSERAANAEWLIEEATVAVIPFTYHLDVASFGIRTLCNLRDHGRPDLVTNAVAVIAEGTATDPRAPKFLHDSLDELGVERIAMVPFDPVLASGNRIWFDRLDPATTRAYTHAAAEVADAAAHALTH